MSKEVGAGGRSDIFLDSGVRFTFCDSRSAIIEAAKFQSPEDSRVGHFSKYV